MTQREVNGRKRVLILGATGSIGVNTLSVIRSHREKFRVTGLSCGKNSGRIAEQISEFKPEAVSVADETAAGELKRTLGAGSPVTVFSGLSAAEKLVRETDADILVNGMVGASGLLPTLAAIEKGMTVALANKETLVIGGEIVTRLAKTNNVSIIPIDSEHSAIWQCLAGERKDEVERLYITGSGGPFLNTGMRELESVTVEQALAHPRWKMGKKITIDSATLMNKGLEVIEARWLFDMPPEKITVLIHRESIIHSMVEFIDGSIKAQLGVTDMYLPIQYALSYPGRFRTDTHRLNIFDYEAFHFQKPDRERFLSLGMALDALKSGGTAPAVLNAANEEAVMHFLEGHIPFLTIFKLVQEALECHTLKSSPVELEDLLTADAWARKFIQSKIR